jgi:hypothetical protein
MTGLLAPAPLSTAQLLFAAALQPSSAFIPVSASLPQHVLSSWQDCSNGITDGLLADAHWDQGPSQGEEVVLVRPTGFRCHESSCLAGASSAALFCSWYPDMLELAPCQELSGIRESTRQPLTLRLNTAGSRWVVAIHRRPRRDWGTALLSYSETWLSRSLSRFNRPGRLIRVGGYFWPATNPARCSCLLSYLGLLDQAGTGRWYP